MATMEKPEQFITTVDLTKPFDENIYQFIYGSQLYGTLFAVYGLFDCTSQANNTVNVNRIRFQLINYRGCVNLGIDHIDELILRKDSIVLPIIKLFVKPLLPSINHIDYYLKDKELQITSDQIIVLERLAMPFDERIKGENTNGESQGKIFFDTEFNYRDGYYENAQPIRPGHIDWEGDLGDPIIFPSLRCIFSLLRVKI